MENEEKFSRESIRELAVTARGDDYATLVIKNEKLFNVISK